MHPRFTDGPSTTREVAENTKADVAFGAPLTATDDDGDTLTYTLGDTADDNAFAIDSMTGQLKTLAELDYEEDNPPKTSYMVTVTVIDGKNAENTVDTTTVDDTITVTIMVTDVNEAPEFPTIDAPIRVAENTVPNANIGTPVVATDVDRPMQSLTYGLSGTDAASFAIDAETGQLKTKADLDYETKHDYEVIVTATDAGGETGTITVIIEVTNVAPADGDTAVANSAPRFNDGPSATREVDENTAAKEDIGDSGDEVDAMDTDAGDGDTLIYGLRGTDAASFAIVATTGQLQTKAALDHETKDTYMVTVTVSDGKDAEDSVDPAVDDTITVTITVMDVNEAPVFPDTIAPIEVAENTVPNANIGDPVVAMDVDADDVLMYMLDAADRTLFAIVEATGQLQTRTALDYETKTDYEVTVTATDDDTSSLSDTITVIINVTNVSVANGDTAVANSAPAFNDGPSTTREVDENTKADVAFGDPVVATDVDRGDTLTYGLPAWHRCSFVCH